MYRLNNNNQSKWKFHFSEYKLLWICIIVIELISVFLYINLRVYNIDEFESIHSGWKILNGENIYEDFIQQKNPVFYYIISIIVYIFGENINTIIAAGYFTFIFSAGIILYTYKLASLLFDKNTAAISALLLPVIPLFALSGYEIRPDVPMLFFCMGSLYHLYKYLLGKTGNDLIISAVFIGISYIFLQKAVFWIVYFAGIIIHRYFRNQFSIKETALYIAIVLAVYCIFLFFIALDISLSSYFFFTYEFVHARQTALGGPFNIPEIIHEIAPISRFVWLILPAFILFILLNRFRNTAQWEIISGAIWLFSTVLLVTHPGDRYFLPAMPLFSIILAHGFVTLAGKYKYLVTVLLPIILIIFSLNLKYLVNDNNVPGTVNQDRNRQLSRVQYVLDITKETDLVYDGMNRFNLFRNDLDFVWLGGDRYIHLSSILSRLIPYEYNIYKLVYNKNPKVISHYYLNTTKYPWILRRYHRSYKFEDIYIRIKNTTGFDYWETYVDKLGTGSKIVPSTNPLNKDGYVRVSMSKAADPASGNIEAKGYPYAGVELQFDKPSRAIDLTECNNIILTYKLTGSVSMILSQENITPGNEYRITLPQTSKYASVTIDWTDFRQPEWITEKIPLEKDKITGVKFQIDTPNSSQAELGIKHVEFSGVNLEKFSKWN